VRDSWWQGSFIEELSKIGNPIMAVDDGYFMHFTKIFEEIGLCLEKVDIGFGGEYG